MVTTLPPTISLSPILIHCLDKHIFLDIDKNIYFYNCPDYYKKDVNTNVNEIISKININKVSEITAKDYTARVSPISDTEIFSPKSYMNFSKCETILRNSYTILPPRKIMLIQITWNNTDDDVFVNQIEYQAFDDNKKILNLSLCNNVDSEIYYSIKENKTNEISLISYFEKKGVNIMHILSKIKI